MESPKREGLREAGLVMKGLPRRKEGRAQNISEKPYNKMVNY